MAGGEDGVTRDDRHRAIGHLSELANLPKGQERAVKVNNSFVTAVTFFRSNYWDLVRYVFRSSERNEPLWDLRATN